MSGTVAGALPRSNKLPQFPGIPVEKLIGKKFDPFGKFPIEIKKSRVARLIVNILQPFLTT